MRSKNRPRSPKIAVRHEETLLRCNRRKRPVHFGENMSKGNWRQRPTYRLLVRRGETRAEYRRAHALDGRIVRSPMRGDPCHAGPMITLVLPQVHYSRVVSGLVSDLGE